MNRVTIGLISTALLLISSSAISATELNIARYVPLEESSYVVDGAIVSATEDGYTLSIIEADPNVVGILTTDPGLEFRPNDTNGKYPVVDRGVVDMRVSSANGLIAVGDYIGTSTIAGVGVKANETGSYIAIALEQYSDPNPDAISTIEVQLELSGGKQTIENTIAFTPGSILENLSTAIKTGDPFLLLKYIIAGIILLLSIIFGFLTFGRTLGNGVEALGRNPLASRAISMGIILNGLLTIVIVSIGAFVAYIILII